METDPASPGDQNTILQKAASLGLGWEPVGGGDTTAIEAKLAEAEKALAKEKEITAGAKIEAERQKQRADAAEKILASAKTVRILEG